MSIVIKTDNLCKTYKIYNKRLDRLKETFLPFGKQYHTPFKALENINLEIRKGDTVGIVGKNGSGKSTLLQIICGILQPTSGNIEVDGRISALLELGAGFNPEFTGLENVYLNASILGMKKEEIDECLDDILKFADIGRFVDQPVKTYSSGMYVRLAFAVAINVKPDILIVDEALSVGDSLFQAKCFAKFKEFQDRGSTILFVTHSDVLVTRYCDSAILLDGGKQVMVGKSKHVVDNYRRLLAGGALIDSSMSESDETLYNSTASQGNGAELAENNSVEIAPEEPVFTVNPNENRYGNGDAEIISFGIKGVSHSGSSSFVTGHVYQFWVKVHFNIQKQTPIIAYTIKDLKGLEIAGTNTLCQEVETGLVEQNNSLLITFEHKLMLNPGDYLLSFGCAGFEDGEYVVYDRRFDVIAFKVTSKTNKVGLIDLDSRISIEIS